jgi:hypothetical protein
MICAAAFLIDARGRDEVEARHQRRVLPRHLLSFGRLAHLLAHRDQHVREIVKNRQARKRQKRA